MLVTDTIQKRGFSVHHKETKEIWDDGNTKPPQGTGFRILRSKVMGLPEPEDHYDKEERSRTHLLLLPKPEKEGAVLQKDPEVLVKALGVKSEVNKLPKELTSPTTKTRVRQKSVLDGKRYGPGKRLY